MDFEIEQLNDIQRKLNFSIPAADVNAELKQAYGRLKKRARIAGFRPGKVPQSILRRRFGDSVTSEVANKFLQQAFEASVQELEYFGQPRVETDGLKEGSDFAFSFILEVEPELGGSDGMVPAGGVAAETTAHAPDDRT